MLMLKAKYRNCLWIEEIYASIQRYLFNMTDFVYNKSAKRETIRVKWSKVFSANITYENIIESRASQSKNALWERQKMTVGEIIG